MAVSFTYVLHVTCYTALYRTAGMISRSLLYGSEVAAILLPTIKNLSFFRKFDPFLHTEATAFLCMLLCIILLSANTLREELLIIGQSSLCISPPVFVDPDSGWRHNDTLRAPIWPTSDHWHAKQMNCCSCTPTFTDSPPFASLKACSVNTSRTAFCRCWI